jgi:hypothetical protein
MKWQKDERFCGFQADFIFSQAQNADFVGFQKRESRPAIKQGRLCFIRELNAR